MDDIMDIDELKEAIEEIDSLDEGSKLLRINLALEQISYHIINAAEKSYPGIERVINGLLSRQEKAMKKIKSGARA